MQPVEKASARRLPRQLSSFRLESNSVLTLIMILLVMMMMVTVMMVVENISSMLSIMMTKIWRQKEIWCILRVGGRAFAGEVSWRHIWEIRIEISPVIMIFTIITKIIIIIITDLCDFFRPVQSPKSDSLTCPRASNRMLSGLISLTWNWRLNESESVFYFSADESESWLKIQSLKNWPVYESKGVDRLNCKSRFRDVELGSVFGQRVLNDEDDDGGNEKDVVGVFSVALFVAWVAWARTEILLMYSSCNSDLHERTPVALHLIDTATQLKLQ